MSTKKLLEDRTSRRNNKLDLPAGRECTVSCRLTSFPTARCREDGSVELFLHVYGGTSTGRKRPERTAAVVDGMLKQVYWNDL